MAEILKHCDRARPQPLLLAYAPEQVTAGRDLAAPAPTSQSQKQTGLLARHPQPPVNTKGVNRLTQPNDDFYATAGDAFTEDADTSVKPAVNTPVPSSRSVVLTELFKNFERLVTEFTCWFVHQYHYKQEHIRTCQVILPQDLEVNAEDIAKQVNNERALFPRNMRGLVRVEAHKINNSTKREVASLRALS